MKIPTAKIPSFLAQPPENINIFLAYGINYGLANERLAYLTRQWLGENKISIFSGFLKRYGMSFVIIQIPSPGIILYLKYFVSFGKSLSGLFLR
mgnify:CR=1 FL=1